MKILVTTDFSANSKGAVRFAQTLAKKYKGVRLVFYHAVEFMKPSVWSDAHYSRYKKEETQRLEQELRKFVRSVAGQNTAGLKGAEYVADACGSVGRDMLKYARDHKVNYICIATRGAGILRKVLGTHTSYVVEKSEIPVFVIPSKYRAKALKRATYLSDLENLKNELGEVSSVAKKLSMKIEVLHYVSVLPHEDQMKKSMEIIRKSSNKGIQLNVRKSNLEQSLVERVSEYVTKSKPGMLIMFTKRERSFFERIFLPSKSAELTYSTKVPVLIYSK
ncbi:MAG: universal stress protein [Bacteroidia bacterium]|nr:universal stress protein [Bacteroidia bacterium]